MSKKRLTERDFLTLNARYEALKQDFEQQRDTYRAIRETSAPALGRGLDGENYNEDKEDLRKTYLKQLHIAGSRSRLILSSGLMSGMTPPSRPWFRLGTPDLDLNKYKPVAKYMYDTAGQMQQIFKAGNVYKMLPLLYGEISAFGTGAAFIAPDPLSVVRAKPLTIGEFYAAQNENYEVDTLYRNIYVTPLQMISAFGYDNVPRVVQEAYRKTTTTMFKVVHVVEPNDDRLDLHSEVPFKRPYRSIYYLPGQSFEDGYRWAIGFGGFDVFPAVVPRWLTIANGTYGVGAGHLALGVNNLLLTEQRRWIKLMDRATGSPLIADERLRDTVLNLTTDSVNFVSGATLNASRSPVMPIFSEQLNYAPLQSAIQDAVMQVEQAYHKDLFLMLANLEREATATEILQREQERIMVLGPVLDNLNSELLDKLIEITYINMLSRGFAPELPPELAGQEIDVEYISTLAVSQKMAGLQSTNQLLGLVGSLAQMYPQVRHKVKPLAVVNQFAGVLGIDPAMLNGDDEAMGMYQQEAQAQMQAQMMAQMPAAVDATQKLGSTQLGQGSILDAMMESGGVQQ